MRTMGCITGIDIRSTGPPPEFPIFLEGRFIVLSRDAEAAHPFYRKILFHNPMTLTEFEDYLTNSCRI